MGRIKTQLIKRTSSELVSQNRESLSKDFTENKIRVGKLAEIRSKKLRNAIAGYATRLMKSAE